MADGGQLAAPEKMLVECLTEFGIPSVSERFKREHVDADMIETLSDGDLARLGVHSIGHRHKLRQMIKAKLEIECQESETVSTNANNGASRSLARAVLNERLRLFSNHHSGGRKRHNSGQSSTVDGKKPKAKAKLKAGFTLQFLCLASKSQRVAPNSAEKEILNNAGLGRKKIRLDKADTQKEVCEKIMSGELDDMNDTCGFPQLAHAGGFELLRSVQNCRELMLINCAWSAKELQKNVHQQATVYIRPIQNNLSTKPMKNITENVSNNEEYKTVCVKCGEEFTMQELREHVESCKSTVEVDKVMDSVEETEESLQQLQGETVIYVFSGDDTNGATNNTNVDHSAIDTVNLDSDTSDEIVLRDHILHGEELHVPTVNETNLSSKEIAYEVATYCKQNSIMDPVEILKKMQEKIVTGRDLELSDASLPIEGDVNFILIDRDNILTTGFDEISSIADTDLRKTLDVQFYNETAADFGGPRKEFLRLILIAIKEKYFDNGLRDLLSTDYEVVGKVFALSILQNGKIPTFMGPDVLKELFDGSPESRCILNLRRGMDALGVYTLCKELPSFVHLFQSTHVTLTFKRTTSLLTPEFSDEGSNSYTFEKATYSAFLRYLREVASGRQNSITLAKVLQFVTGADEEPVLGFKLHPSIVFHPAETTYLPTANTCINCLRLPRPTYQMSLPEDSLLFKCYDYAFSNTFYGLK